MEFFLIFLGALFFWIHGAYTGWKARETQLLKLIEKLEGLEEQEETEAPTQIVVEEHHGILYVYDKTDNTFMAQGKNRNEVEEALATRFPGRQFSASQEHLDKLGIKS
jgi:hypothetical protein